jgi:hypothetical protein
LLARSGLLLLLGAATCFAAVSAVALAATGIGDTAVANTAATSWTAALAASPSPALVDTPSPATTPFPAPSLAPTGDVPVPPAIAPSSAAVRTPGPARPTTRPAAVLPAAAAARNYLAIPALRIDAPIGITTCGGLIPNGIWKWPCAGQNNLYLLGHAWGVFKPLHDGYHAGLLTPGLTALYTDGSGAVHRYRLLRVEHLTVADWGKGATWAGTSGPVITLQTCDGATDAYRIIVRLVPA